ncbi:Alpha-1,6-mannosyl-glycoprotein 2-beta-N-acetylglucosaminyltransferase [Chamberlinius hualienensis]
MPKIRFRSSPVAGGWCPRVFCFMRTPLLLCVVFIIWIQLLISSKAPPSVLNGQSDSSGAGGVGLSDVTGPDRVRLSYNDFISRIRNLTSGNYSNVNFTSRMAIANNYSNQETLGTNSVHNVTDIRWLIQQANQEQKMWNEERWGPITPDTVIFLVQVHTRLPYLLDLLESFRNTKGIEGALIIFSHDVYDNDINAAVQAIDFARVLQIFYPYSTQLYSNVFPGQDPNDCFWNMSKEKALEKKCNNAEHPDLYGHYREAKYTQIKHHWWWKIGRVFGGLRATRNHTGLVVLLEEDHYVVPDVLHVLGLLGVAQQQHCSQCNVLSLGTYLKSVNFGVDSSRIEIWPWIASKHNMGMVLKRSTWDQIRTCSEKFCKFDDYNWDWSLQHISANCLKNKLQVLMVKAPRVFHIGECGVHHKDKNCSVNQMISKVRKLMTSAKKHMFPSKLTLTRTSQRATKSQKGNGGWGDVRDHWLCLHLLNETSVLS